MTEVVKCAHDVSATDLERGKQAMLALCAGTASSAYAVSQGLGKELLYLGRTLPFEELVARINAVTVSDVRDVVGRYVYDRDPAVAIVGAQADYAPDFNRVRSWSYSLIEAGGPGFGGATVAGPTSDPTSDVLENIRRGRA
jgi:processing peptidase subunit beta